MPVYDWKHFHNVLRSDPMFRWVFLIGNIFIMCCDHILCLDACFWLETFCIRCCDRILCLEACFFIGNIFIICCIISDRILCLDACFYWKHFHNVLYNQRSDPMFRSLIWWEYYRTFPTSDFLLIWNRPIACDWSIWLYAAWMYKYAWEGCRL